MAAHEGPNVETMRRLRLLCPVIIHKIRLESNIDESTMDLQIPGDKTIGDIKQMYCDGKPHDPQQIILWWCGEDLEDHVLLEEDFCHREHIVTTFHVDFRSDDHRRS